MRVERVLAPNPGPYTGPGTNSYVITSAGEAVVLDPGPVIGPHLDAIERALGSDTPIAVNVTHTHPDHAPAANVLADRLEVPAIGFGPGPEFEPTSTMADGDALALGDIALVAVHTPGHTPDHLCYRIADVIFTGDHIMGGSSVVITDASAYMASLQKVASLRPAHLYPGHGPELPDAGRAIADYIEHRLEREQQVIAAVAEGAAKVSDIVRIVYGDLAVGLRPAASAQVEVQLVKLVADDAVTWPPET